MAEPVKQTPPIITFGNRDRYQNMFELYTRTAVLLSTGDPADAISEGNILHSIVYSKNDGSKDCSFWKGHAAIDLATIYLAGVESCDNVAEDGKIYADTYIEAYLLKSYDLCRRAIKHNY